MSESSLQKIFPNLPLEDEPPNVANYIEPGNDIHKTIAWTVEKEVEKLSMTIKEEMSGAVGRVEKSLSQILLIQSKQFCERTSLHGLAYIGEENRPWWERVIWVLSLCCFLLFGGYVMKPIYEKWQFAPTITTVENTNYPISQIYFPAVTICSNNKVEISRIDKVLEEEPWLSLHNKYPNLNENLKLALISVMTLNTKGIDDNNIVKVIINELKDNITYLAQKAALTCHDIILYCEWHGQAAECGDLFEARKTDYGFCCSFNTIRVTEQFISNEEILSTYEEYVVDDEYHTKQYYSEGWSTLTTGCPSFDSLNFGFCDFEALNPYCNYDNGNCCDAAYYPDYFCLEEIYTYEAVVACPLKELMGDLFEDKYCQPSDAPKCPFPHLIGDGHCSCMMNNVFCHFDGGDCLSNDDCYISSTSFNDEGCPYPGADKMADGFCDDINNHPGCRYDGGDCCNIMAIHNVSGCLDPKTGPKKDCYRPLWVGDGFCDDYTNNEGCNFDGGDCCLENVNTTYCFKCECIKGEPSDNTTRGKDSQPTVLKRTNVANSRLGLSVILYPNAKDYHSLNDNSFEGFKVLVHSPYDFAEVSGKGILIGAAAEAFIAVGAQYTTTSEEILKLPLEKRKCLSHNEDLKQFPEVRLEAFQNYSRKACLLECQARNLLSVCHCLPYYFPDFGSIWKLNTACNYKGLQCLTNATDQAKALQPEGQSDLEGYIQNAPNCYCPNDCDETTYNQEMSFFNIAEGAEFIENLKKEPYILFKKQSLIDENFISFEDKQLVKYEMEQINGTSSIVHIYFKEVGIMKFSRDQAYSVMDVIAAFGGIIGLCCGFSMISIVEILYWFSIRIYTDHYR